MLDHGAQRRGLVGAANAVEDAAGLERRAQPGDRRRVALGLIEQVGRDVEPARGRPLEQLGAVETVLIVQPVRGEQALVDPPVHGLLGYLQQPGDVADG
jgi:hypothetical protein